MAKDSNDSLLKIMMLESYKRSCETFRMENVQHSNDVIDLCRFSSSLLEWRANHHDADKLAFTGNLSEWKELFKQGEHFIGNYDNTHHHKEDVEDIIGVLEMLADWVAASARRNGLLDPETTRLPNLDWEKLVRNTLKILVDYWNSKKEK